MVAWETLAVRGRTARTASLAGMLAMSVSACAQEARDHDAVRICALLAEPAVGDPAYERAGGGSLATTLLRTERTVGSNLSVYLTPAAASGQLDVVAMELEALPDVQVVATLDQDAVFEEFKGYFADDSELISTVTPDILPPAVRLRVSSDAAVRSIEDRFGDDPVVYDVVALAHLVAQLMPALEATHAEVLDELERLAVGDLGPAVRTLRSIDRGVTNAEATVAIVELRRYHDEHCADP